MADRAPACRSTRSPRAARRPLSGSRKRTWCPPARTCAPATTPLPSWSRRCGTFCVKVNTRMHRETHRVRRGIAGGQGRMYPVPAAPFTAALGERPERSIPIRRSGSGRCATPTPPGLIGPEVWVRVDGEELVIAASGDLAGRAGLVGVARHRLSTPGTRGSTCRTIPTTPRIRTGHPGRPTATAQRCRRRSWPWGRGARLAGRGRRGRRAAGPVEG